MFKKFAVLLLVLISFVVLIGTVNAGDLGPTTAPPTDPTRIFIQSQGEMTFTVQMSKGTVAVWPPGQEPPLVIDPCENDGYELSISPLWQKFSVDYVIVSSSTGCLSYWNEGDWEEIENGAVLSFGDAEGVCFASCEVTPGDDDDDCTPGDDDDDCTPGDDDDDDGIVEDASVDAYACLPCALDPAAFIVEVENSCNENYWTFKFNVESCDTVCSIDVTFMLDCDLLGDREYGIWELISSDCTGCSWEFLGGEFSKNEECPPECMLSWTLEKPDEYSGDFFCDLMDRTFGVGPKPPTYVIPEPGDNEGEMAPWGDWMIYLGQCNPESGDVMASFDIATQPDDGLEPGDAFYFTLEFENPENICEVDLYLYLKDCSDEKGIWEFLDGAWEEFAGYFEWEAAGALPWRVNGTDYYCRIHVFYPPVGEEPGVPIGDDDDDDDDGVFGVGTDEYFNPASPGGDDDDDSSSGGGGCSIGSSLSPLLLMIPVGWILYRKRQF